MGGTYPNRYSRTVRFFPFSTSLQHTVNTMPLKRIAGVGVQLHTTVTSAHYEGE
jgi:hypothetical protein